MSDRFEGLQKIPEQPAARLLALANARLGVKLEAPASALVPEVLEELATKGAMVDMLRMLAVALPARERVWWACLAARDMLAYGAAENPAIVEATEAWVYKPEDQNLIAVRRAVEAGGPDEPTNYCGNAALTWDGKLGPEDLHGLDGPPGASETYALVMNVHAMCLDPTLPETRVALLIDRALDIARGGQGDVEAGAGAAPAEGGKTAAKADVKAP